MRFKYDYFQCYTFVVKASIIKNLGHGCLLTPAISLTIVEFLFCPITAKGRTHFKVLTEPKCLVNEPLNYALL